MNNKNDNNNNDNNEALKMLAVFGQFGWTIAAPITISILLGNRLDKFFNLSPVFLLIGIVFGVVVAVKNLFAFIDKFGK